VKCLLFREHELIETASGNNRKQSQRNLLKMVFIVVAIELTYAVMTPKTCQYTLKLDAGKPDACSVKVFIGSYSQILRYYGFISLKITLQNRIKIHHKLCN